MKKTIRIHYTNFWDDFNPNTFAFTEILRTRYNVILDEKNPEFLFYANPFFQNNTYQDCVKIFFTGENISPNFNMADYAIGFDFLTFADRYFRLPLFYLNKNITHKSQNPLERKFCNFIYSNSRFSDPFRGELFHALSSYRQVDSGGGLFNNIGGKIENKFLWQQEYKFSIASENSAKIGYTTEKILDALQANTVPIYWGNPLIEEDFSKDCFINAMNFSSLQELVEYIKFLDQNDEEYLKILNAPWQTNSNLLRDAQKTPAAEHEEFKKFLFTIFDQEPEQAKRIPNYGNTQIIDILQNKMFSWYNKRKQAENIIKHPIRNLKEYLQKKLTSKK